MPKVVREDIDNLNAVLTITLERSDLESRFHAGIEKYRKQANMKGFRKGKMPLSLLRKMYGKSVLAELANELLQKELNDFLSNSGIEILGNPIQSDQQKDISFEVKDWDDMEFKFDLGLTPEFELKGVSKENVFEKHVMKIPEEEVNKHVESVRKQLGNNVNPDGDIQENDLVKFRGRELDGDQIKEGGIECEFKLLVEKIDSEEIKKDLLGRNKGDTLRLNVFELEKDDEPYVRKYILGLEESDERQTGPMYEVTIEEISRVEPAPLDQEFFDKYFGEGVVNSEEEFFEKVRESLSLELEGQSDSLLYRDFQKKLMEDNPIELPDNFLKRWLKSEKEETSDEEIEKEYGQFALGLRWSLIKNKILKEFGLVITPEEVANLFGNRIKSYFGNQFEGSDKLIKSMVDRMMNDPEQYQNAFNELKNIKVFNALKENLSIRINEVGEEEFNEIIKKANEEDKAIYGDSSEQDEEE